MGTMRRLVWSLLVVHAVAMKGEARTSPPGTSPKVMKTHLGLCFEVNPAYLDEIGKTVSSLRDTIRAQRSKGRIIAYVSVPLTARAGGYRPLNVEISRFLKDRVERRYGEQLWALAPGQVESEMPAKEGETPPKGGDYMYMWTEALAGDNRRADDFDLLYVAGPTDIQAFLAASSDQALFASLERFIVARSAGDPTFAQFLQATPTARRDFMTFYGLKASGAFSAGAHDEWNIFVEVNRERRKPAAGSADSRPHDQVPMYFDGRSVNASDMEVRVSPGYETSCK